MLAFGSLLVFVFVLSYATRAVLSFQTSFNGFSQCEQAPLQWSGSPAAPPFEFLVAPINSSVSDALVVKVPDATWNATSNSGSYILPPFPLAAGSQYLAILSDNSGTGGVSLPFTVGSSTNDSCLQTPIPPPSPNLFALSNPPRQCEPLTISWNGFDPRIQSQVFIRGFIPGRSPIALNTSTPSTNSSNWTVNLPFGTQIMFLYSTGGAVGSATLLQTSQLFTVQGDAKSSTSCLVAATPSPTTSAPTSSSATPTTSCIDGDDGNTSWGAKMSHTNSSKLPLIVGLSVGGVAGLLLLLILFYLFRRRRIEGQQQPAVPPPTPGQISWLAHPGPVHPGAGPSSSISAFGTTSSKGKGKPRRTTLDSSALGAGPSRSASGSPYAVDPSIPMPDLDLGALEAAGPSNQFIAPATQLQAQPAATIPPIEPSTQAAQHQDSSPAPTPQPTNPSELPPVHEEASQDLPQQPQQESPGQPPTPPPERRDKTPPP